MSDDNRNIAELVLAIHHTVEYVGYETLPPRPGWSWYDALRKYDPALAEHHRQRH